MKVRKVISEAGTTAARWTDAQRGLWRRM